METYKDIPGYEGLYQASDFGNVKSLVGRYGIRERVLLQCTSRRVGYRMVTLCKNKKHLTKNVHRLVIAAFLGESELDVNHKDGNKENNRLVNLEYVTAQENTRHAISRGLIVPNVDKIAVQARKPVLQMTSDGKIVNRFISAHEAAKLTGYNRGNISSCCRGVAQKAMGFIWRYET